AHAVAGFESLGVFAFFDNDADDFVSGHERQFGIRQFAVHDVQIRAADGAGGHFHQNLRCVGLWRGYVNCPQRLPRCFQNHRAHEPMESGLSRPSSLCLPVKCPDVNWWVRRCRGARRCSYTAATQSGHCRSALQIDSALIRVYADADVFMSELQNSLLELIRRTSAEIPDDVQKAILDSLEQEKKGTIAENALKIIERNVELAKQKSQPICQDTGSILFYVDSPVGYDQIAFEEAAKEAVKLATKKGYLRQNSVDSLTGMNDGTNVGPGAPAFHFHQHRSPEVSVRLVLKGGGCENVGAQYSLPSEMLNANRDLDGCRKAILDAVLQAQGKGCGPGILGVCIGGDRATGYEMSKTQFLRLIPDRNPNPELDKLEQDILKTANELGIG